MKTIVLCVDLKKECLNTLKTVTKIIDLRDTQVHLLHIYEGQIFNADLTPWIIPEPEQYPSIEKSILKTLSKLRHELDLNPDNVKEKCIFSFSREQEIKNYLLQNDASLVVLATRGKHGIEGLFLSSLADFLCKYSPCDVLVLRPQKIT